MNSQNSKELESGDYCLILQINKLKRSDKYLALSNLSMYCIWKNAKTHAKTQNLKPQLQFGVKNVSYLTDHTPYQI